MITPEQSQEARRLLGWEQLRLALMADLALPTVERFEFGADCAPEALAAIRAALEAAGVEFIPENGGGPGVRLRKRAGDRAQTTCRR
jgi:hypothetical protein